MTDLPAIEIRAAVMDHNTAILGDTVTSGREQGPDLAIEASNGLFFADLSLNTSSGTSFAAAGVETTFGDWLFFRPALGLAVHDGHLDGGADVLKLGSRVLIYARADFGIRFDDMSVALRIEHLSNGPMPGPNNGLDNWGLVLAKRF